LDLAGGRVQDSPAGHQEAVAPRPVAVERSPVGVVRIAVDLEGHLGGRPSEVEEVVAAAREHDLVLAARSRNAGGQHDPQHLGLEHTLQLPCAAAAGDPGCRRRPEGRRATAMTDGFLDPGRYPLLHPSELVV
jgi:hypothetical protein